ncbi:phosphate signaling complex protein PhoU [Bacillus massiliigorillae]|uniref:phosphate signaling complex protein PhoU n=1 Tax=Bacillus massiliigorillae TaxID=1243664 RepID=UPI00039AD79B|nr:phosphate signaling complex protein PhoU [Bacillus massiliigorillae]
MIVREKFEDELHELSDKLVMLAKLAEQALNKAFTAFETQDHELALRVLEEDEQANMLEEEINDFALLLIAKQQPVAIDLRRIIVGIKIAADIERMADYGVNIAKASIRLGKNHHIIALDDLKKMHQIMIEMLNQSINAYAEEDVHIAKKIAKMDDEVDHLYGQCMKVLLRESSENFQQISQLSFIARHIERSADHATNIAENIYYLVRGRHLDLNK